MSEIRHWRFDPLDTWFFREARGFETSGHNELSSLFPPPARTVAGAMRTLIGEHSGVDWPRFLEGEEYAELRALIGAGDSLGRLELTGPYPLWQGERLYPVPLHLLGKDRNYRFLEPGDPVLCDLGPVRLPRIKNARQDPLPGAKPLEQAWLNGADLQRVLGGQPPNGVIATQRLYVEEPRLGIARDNMRRTGRDGLLYQTRHVRPHPELAIGAETRGLPAERYPESGVMRFGGEGRPSLVRLSEALSDRLPAPLIQGPNLLLMLLTHADFGSGEECWRPPGFEPIERDGTRVWQGDLRGIGLTLECAVIGKAAREGGWDLARECPRPVRSLVPAGSVYFCTLADGIDVDMAIKALHGQHIGQDIALGRGELAVGTW